VPKKIVNVYGVAGEGATLRQAKEDAGRRIEAALSGNYTPKVIFGREHYAIICREPFGGWQRQVARIGTEVRGCVSGGYTTRQQAEDEARYDIAQREWLPDGDDDFSYIVEDTPSLLRLARWAYWQRDYLRLIKKGLTPGEAHLQARDTPVIPPPQGNIHRAETIGNAHLELYAEQKEYVVRFVKMGGEPFYWRFAEYEDALEHYGKLSENSENYWRKNE